MRFPLGKGFDRTLIKKNNKRFPLSFCSRGLTHKTPCTQES